MTKKILIIVTKGEVGGAQQFVFNLAKGTHEKGCDITVGFGDGVFLPDKLKAENIKYHQFKHLKRTNSFLLNFLFILELRRYINQNEFSIVHFNSTNSLFGAIGAKLSNIKPRTIFTFHGLSYLDAGSNKNFLIKLIFYLFFKLCLLFIDKNIFICRANLDYAKKIKLVKNGDVIYNGIENIYLSKEKSIKFLSNIIGADLQNKKIIGSIGRLAYPKNYEFLIKAASKLGHQNDNFIFVIIGEGPERKKYENLIRQYNLEKKFFLPGEIKNASLYIKAFDLFVLTSKFEGMPITLLEALGADVAIVASQVGGVKELLSDDESIYQPDNLDDFLKKVKNKITGQRKTNTKNIKNDFSIEKMVNEYMKFYEL